MKIIIIFIFWTFAFWSQLGIAATVTAKIYPESPIAGEVFELRFEIEGSFDAEPFISFDKSSIEVLGKNEQGVSLSTTIVNGRIVTRKISKYAYSLKADRAGSFRIRNIKTVIDNEEIKSADILVNVLQEKKEPEDAFLKAEIDKSEVYVGEAVRVDYYLYYRVFVRSQEIREFPKLNGFIKRFYMPNEAPVRVEHGGEIYQRSAKYSAILFPEKEGELTIDPLKISLDQEIKRGNSQLLGAYGFSMGQFRPRNLSSDKISVKTIPLPTDKLPKDFIGLVGNHKFNFKIDKTKFLINEPIEFSLEIEGNGALEKVDEPIFYSDKNLEKFDTKSDLVELSPGLSKKIFSYTYLGRGPLKIEESNASLSYFDPKSRQYVEYKFKLPAIEVIGTAMATNSNLEKKTQVQDAHNDQIIPTKKNDFIPPAQKIILAPIFSDSWSTKLQSISFINKCLLSLHLIVLLLLANSFRKQGNITATQFDSLIRKLKKGDMTYNQFLSLMDFFRTSHNDSIEQVINRMNITSEAKTSLKGYLKKLEKNFYDLNGSSSSVKFEKKYIGQIKKLGPVNGYITES